MTDLADLVDAYKREVAVPGTFSEAFPQTAGSDILGALADAFAEAQLDGFFHAYTLDLDDKSISPDLSTAGAALVVLYGGMRLIRQQIRNLRSEVRYKAGPVEVQQASAASALTEDLKFLRQRRDELLELSRRARGAATFVIDAYVARTNTNVYGGFFPGEVQQQSWSF